LKTRPFREIPVSRKGKRPGRGGVTPTEGHKMSHANHIAWINLIYITGSTIPWLIWGSWRLRKITSIPQPLRWSLIKRNTSFRRSGPIFVFRSFYSVRLGGKNPLRCKSLGGPGRCSNLAENMLTKFLRGLLREKLAPARNSDEDARKRPGQGGVLWI